MLLFRNFTLPVVLTTAIVFGCADENGKRLFTDPVTNEDTVFEGVNLDGWELYKNGDGSGDTVMLVKDGDLVAIVTDIPGLERQINIDSENKAIRIQLKWSGNSGHIS